MIRPILDRAWDQMTAAGLFIYIVPGTLRPDGKNWRCRFNPTIFAKLAGDSGETGHWTHFINSPFHTDMGEHVEYRSHQDAFGDGSLHLSINRVAGEATIDLDEHCPEDVVGAIGHAGEVIGNDGPTLVGRIWGWLKRKVRKA